MQGKVKQVVNMKPIEILGLMEEAAGTSSFQIKRESSLKMSKNEQIDELWDILMYFKSELGAQNATIIWGNEKLGKLKPLMNVFFEQFGGVMIHYRVNEIERCIERYGLERTEDEMEKLTIQALSRYWKNKNEDE